MFRRAFLLAATVLGLLVATPALAAVNINTATETELETLPGIGPSKATAILAYRQEHGAFKSVDELDNVNGIGPATLASLRDLVTVGDGKTTASAGTTGTSTGTTATTSTATPAKTTPAPTPPAAATPAASGSCPVNINTADAGGMKTMPGIGDTKAAAIVAYRNDHGAFKACSELDNVSGIGAATLSGLQDCCVVK